MRCGILKKNGANSGSGRLWIVILGRLLDWECGRRDAATLKKLVDRLAPWEVTFSCTDHWPVYAAVIPPEKLVMSQARTEGSSGIMAASGIGLAASNGRRSWSPRPRTWWS